MMLLRCLQTMEKESVSRKSTINEFNHLPNLGTGFKSMKWDEDEYREYHILPCWLNMIRVVVVNKDRDVFWVIIVDF